MVTEWWWNLLQFRNKLLTDHWPRVGVLLARMHSARAQWLVPAIWEQENRTATADVHPNASQPTETADE